MTDYKDAEKVKQKRTKERERIPPVPADFPVSSWGTPDGFSSFNTYLVLFKYKFNTKFFISLLLNLEIYYRGKHTTECYGP